MANKKDKRRKFLDIRVIGIVIGLLVFAAVAFLSEATDFQLFKNMELSLLDQYFRYREEAAQEQAREGVTRTVIGPKVSDQIVIIGIDSQSFQILGGWPWPRDVQARVLQSAARIRNQQNREQAMLLDVFYFDPHPPEEEQVLTESIQENGRVFLENVLDNELPASDAQRRRMYAYQDFLFRQYPPLTRISGDWRELEHFMSEESPLPRFAAVMKGFGHASYRQDRDEVYRRAILVARFSRLTEETDVAAGRFVEEMQRITVDPDNFEWIAWKDKHGFFRRIPESVLRDPNALTSLSAELRAEALTDVDEASNPVFRIRRFKDYFIPSIVLSLALNYYHKTPDQVEVRLGEYIRIPDPEVYVITDPDVSNPKGEWQPCRVNGTPVREIRIPIDKEGKLLINFMGSSSDKSNTYIMRPFYQYANPGQIPQADAPPEQMPISRGLRNSIAVVCAYAQGMDEKTTPFGLMYGGEVHANALNTIIMQNFLYTPPLLVTLLMILTAALFAGVISSRLPPLLSLFISFWLISVYFFVVIQVFDNNNLILNFSAPTIAVFITILSVVAYRVIFEERDKRRIKLMFTKYVSPAVVEQLLVHPPELGGVDKEITVLFSDIRGYTSLSETMSAQALVNHLNLYLTK
ncbi:MAG TPA: CHASE2 domain-containing protein, partial [Spirochaetia bacterium]|nr:CHASE2 domain-containing protein [Spirochaetia bacterium]